MSLTSWFRDYLFIPMGGSRGSPARTYFNLYVVFVLCGFWHGASWNFIAFGFLHGTYLVIHRFWSTSEAARGSLGRLFAFLGWPLTTLVLFLSWPLFRSESLAKTGTMYELMFGGGTPGTSRLSPLWVLGGLALLGIHIVSRKRLVAPAFERLSDWSWSLGFGAAAALAVTFVASGYKAFIYFQF
jgi:alginate O-acetyltransferase complex protein AlgI